MNFFRNCSLFFLLPTLFSNLIAQTENPYQFISPKPSSIMVNIETNIILKHFREIDVSTLEDLFITVEGSKSGHHTGELILSNGGRTIVFNPNTQFAGDENVTVILADGIQTLDGIKIPKFSFNFQTAPIGIVQIRNASFSNTTSLIEDPAQNLFKTDNTDALLPAPPITIDSLNNPAEGNIFMATWDRNVPAKYDNFIFILDKNGEILDSVRVNGAPFDFQVQQNGLLTYALGDFSLNVPLPSEELQHIVMDSTLTVVDSFKMKNGYITDFHEFKMLPNGHVMMMSYHTIIYDMSKIVEGGKTDAQLVINIIQEQDKEKNVVFEWRNIDYIPITDSDLDLTVARINYGTLNAFDVDIDGNILASFRNHSEIMKISKETGEVMWRMGGPRGEFTFVGEHEENAPYYHSRQHNIRRRPNGNITMFDNGQFHQLPYSRAVEYELDEVNKIATMVNEWKYPNGNIFCVTAGNAETLEDGGWFIGYGVPNPQFVYRNAVEVHADGSIALEFSLPKGVLAYRAYKFPWKSSIDKRSFTNFEVKEGSRYSFNNESIITGVEIQYILLPSPDYNEVTIIRLPYGPVKPEFINNNITVFPVSIIYEGFAINTQTAELHIDLEQFPEITNPENTIIHYRQFPNQGLFVPHSTTYDSIQNELITTLNGFGEIVFGVPVDDVENNTPILYEPENKQKLVLQDSITIRWTGKGMYNLFNVQISTDSNFTSIIKESNTNLSDLTIGGLTNNSIYYWRVNSVLDSKISEWSDVWSFNITGPFISNVVPKGGEVWASGNSEIIRWETNILGNVYIDLLQNQNTILSLDTIAGNYQAYEWNIPTDLQIGENFRIQITSEDNSTIFNTSLGEFSVIDTTTSVSKNENHIPNEYSLNQNYPNPFNPTTTIQFSIPSASNVKLSIFNILGKEIKTLMDTHKSPGTYSIKFDASELSSGIYFYKLETEYFRDVRKCILLR